jgi:hypothetical protein
MPIIHKEAMMTDAIEKIVLESAIADTNSAEDYRVLFLAAIETQEEVKRQADRTIEHYRYALSEMARQSANDNHSQV